MIYRQRVSLFLLSAAAGCVDAVGFLHSGVFPANMTGNSVMLALALTKADITGVASAGIVLVGFIIGASLAAWMVAKGDCIHEWTPAVTRALFVAAGVLLLCVGAIAFFGLAWMPYLIGIAGAAMGMQSAAILRLGVPGIATTVITGTLTTAVAQTVAQLKQWRLGQPRVGNGPGLATASWAGYFGGALVGGIHGLLGLVIVSIFPIALMVIAARCRTNNS